jgi:hypothetical protein
MIDSRQSFLFLKQPAGMHEAQAVLAAKCGQQQYSRHGMLDNLHSSSQQDQPWKSLDAILWQSQRTATTLTHNARCPRLYGSTCAGTTTTE